MTVEPPAGARDPSGAAVPVDALAMGGVGLGAVAASVAIAPGWAGLFGAALAIIATAVAFIDRRWFIIPDELNALAFLIGLIAVWQTTEIATGWAIAQALLRAALMYAVFFAFRVLYRRFRGREGMGMGDVKLAAVAGVWLGWADLPIAVDIAALVALSMALLARLAGRKSSSAERLPFGLFFAPAIWICWLFAAWRGDWASMPIQ